jgi:hypothetical protein
VGQPGTIGQPGGTGGEGAAGTPSFANLGAGAGIGSSVALAAPGGYLDNPIPKTMVRLRYDAGFDMDRPDRAEFFYGQWKELSFHPHGINGGGAYFDPKARGPEQLPRRLDFQDISSYAEWAVNRRLSLFVDVPVRFLHIEGELEDPDHERMPNGRFFPEPRAENTEAPKNFPGGLSDVTAGFKFALIADPDRYLTFQLRAYTNTGNVNLGLGTGHVSLEPGLLYYQRLTDKLVFQGQFSDWIPIDGGKSVIDGTNFAGNVLIYGLGLGYDVYTNGNLRITPITEFMGWTVLNGLESIAGDISATPPPGIALPKTHGVEDASGTTIVNAKIGVRTYFGSGHDIYVGWGHSLTGERWYRDIARVEYRYSF